MLKQLIQGLADRDGGYSGWRGPAAILLAGIFIPLMTFGSLGKTPNTINAAIVCFVLAVLLAGLMAVYDRVRRSEKRMQEIPPELDPMGFESNELSASIAGSVAGIIILPLVCWAMVPRMWQEWATLGWPSVVGHVQNVEVRNINMSWKVEASMRYDVGGDSYRSKLDVNGMNDIKYEHQARALAATFARGSTHPVYYNPKSPETSSLVQGPTTGTMIASVSLPIISLGLFVLAVRTLIQSTKTRWRLALRRHEHKHQRILSSTISVPDSYNSGNYD